MGTPGPRRTCAPSIPRAPHTDPDGKGHPCPCRRAALRARHAAARQVRGGPVIGVPLALSLHPPHSRGPRRSRGSLPIVERRQDQTPPLASASRPPPLPASPATPLPPCRRGTDLVLIEETIAVVEPAYLCMPTLHLQHSSLWLTRLQWKGEHCSITANLKARTMRSCLAKTGTKV